MTIRGNRDELSKELMAYARKAGATARQNNVPVETMLGEADQNDELINLLRYSYEAMDDAIKNDRKLTQEHLLSGDPTLGLPREKLFALQEEQKVEIEEIFAANVYFGWSWKFCGYGQLSFSFDKETGKITCSNEAMGRESIRKMLYAFADHVAENAVLDIDSEKDE